jgi:hypothetical protein
LAGVPASNTNTKFPPAATRDINGLAMNEIDVNAAMVCDGEQAAPENTF